MTEIQGFTVSRLIDRIMSQVRRLHHGQLGIARQEVLELLRERIDEFCMRTRIMSMDWVFAVKYDGTEADGIYNLPDRVIDVFYVEYAASDGTRTEMSRMSLRDRGVTQRVSTGPTTRGLLVGWWIQDGSLFVWPLPQSNESAGEIHAFMTVLPAEITEENSKLPNQVRPWMTALRDGVLSDIVTEPVYIQQYRLSYEQGVMNAMRSAGSREERRGK